MIENPQHFNLITNFEEITSRPNFVEKVTIARVRMFKTLSLI